MIGECETKLNSLREKHGGNNHQEIFNFLQDSGKLFNSCGDYKTALQYYEQSLEMGIALLGNADPQVGDTYADIARLHTRKGKYWLAEDCLNCAKNVYDSLPMQELYLPKIENLLGIQARERCQYERAAQLHQQALHMHTIAQCGEDNIEVALTYKQIGNLFFAQNDFQNASKSFSKAYSCLEACSVSQTMSERIKVNCKYAMAECALGNYQESHANLLRAKAQTNRYNGPDKVFIESYVLAHQGELHKNMRNVDPALEELTQAQNKIIEFYGEEMPKSHHLADLYVRYADCIAQLGNFDIAIENCEAAKQLFEDFHQSSEHRDIGRVYQNLADIYLSKGDFNQSLVHLLKALGVFRSFHGTTSNHIDIASSYSQLASLYCQISDFDNAHRYNSISLRMNKHIFNCNINTMAISKNYAIMSEAYFGQDNYQAAKQFIEKSVRVLRAIYRQNSPHHDYLSLLNTLGTIWSRIGDENQMRANFTRSLGLSKLIYPSQQHMEHAKCLMKLGEAECYLENYNRALAQYQSAFAECEGHERAQDYDSMEKSQILYALGAIRYKIRDYESATVYLNESRQHIGILIRNDNHDLVSNCQKIYADIYEQIGSYIKAFDLYTKSLNMKEEVFSAFPCRCDIAELNRKVGQMHACFCLFEDSLKYHQKSLAIAGQIYKGMTNVAYAECFEAVAVAYTQAGDYDSAKPLYKAALDMKLIVQERMDIQEDVAKNYSLIGEFYMAVDQYSVALDWFRAAGAICEDAGLTLELAHSLDGIGKALCHTGDYRKGKGYINQAICRKLQLFNDEKSTALRFLSLASERMEYIKRLSRIEAKYYPSLAKSLRLMGDAYYSEVIKVRSMTQSDSQLSDLLTDALLYYQLALDTLARVYDDTHKDVTAVYNMIGIIFRHPAVTSKTKAVENHSKALTCRKTVYLKVNENHPDLGESYLQLAISLLKSPPSTYCCDNLATAMEIINAHYGPDSRSKMKATALEAFGQAEFLADNFEAALDFFLKSHSIYIEKYTKNKIVKTELAQSFENLINAYTALQNHARIRECKNTLFKIQHDLPFELPEEPKKKKKQNCTIM